MPSTVARRTQKRKRSFSAPSRNARPKMPGVPRAILTRGTPSGYTELTVNQLYRVYFDKTGFYDTNQSTGVPTGSGLGFGLAYSSQLSNDYLSIGSGVISQAIPQFSQLQAVFDQCKIVKCRVEFWYTCQAPQQGVSTSPAIFGAPDLWMVFDPNNGDVPTALSDICNYRKVVSIRGDSSLGPKSITFTPDIRVSASTAIADSGTTVAVGINQPSTYCSTSLPTVMHYGLRGYLNMPQPIGTNVSLIGELHVKITQTRRWKAPQ